MIPELKRKGLPSFIKDAAIFKQIKSLDKVFPKIGLPNCEEIVKAEKRKTKPKDDLTKKVVAIAKSLRKKRTSLSKTKNSSWRYRFSYHTYGYSYVRKPRSAIWIANKTKMISLMDRLATEMEKKPSSFVVGTKLVIPKKISAAGLTVKKGSMATQFKKLNRKVKSHKLPLGRIEPRIRNRYRRTGLLSLQGKKIVFSSTGKQGAWDMATMSMRGIHSCQSWNGSYRNNLIGSIADPYAGIIYLTSKDKTNHGSKMHYRSVVRLVIDRTTKKPAILLEHIYPNGLSVEDRYQAEALFRAFITNKGCKLPIFINYATNHFIPSSTASHCSHPSYRDSGTQYERIGKKQLNEILKSQ